jgi:hypothetical protein
LAIRLQAYAIGGHYAHSCDYDAMQTRSPSAADKF